MISMEKLVVGKKYSRDDLVNIWGYKKRQAISRGIVTPSNDDKIILFVTGKKQKSEIQYNDYFIEDGILHMEGENKKLNDKRIINAEKDGDKIFLFYRDIHHTPFHYFGRVFLISYQEILDRPTEFILAVAIKYKKAMENLISEDEKSGISTDFFEAGREGKVKFEYQRKFERNIKNRTQAIEIHGIDCKICGFNFNEFYGEELAKGFIEVHHIEQLANFINEKKVDPATDLVPVCSNCHSMIHKKKNNPITIDDLKRIINRKK